METREGVEAVREEDRDRLLELWEASVRATHHFLSEEDIQFFRPRVLDLVFGLEHVYGVRGEDGGLVGFAGVAQGKIEALFVDPAFHGRGLGRRMLEHAVRNLRATDVEVNEQNEGAVGFYRHHGFEVVRRSALDATGKPFPLLHLRLSGVSPRVRSRTSGWVALGYLVALLLTLFAGLLNTLTFATSDYSGILLVAVACAAAAIVLILVCWRRIPPVGRAMSVLLLLMDLWVLLNGGGQRLFGWW